MFGRCLWRRASRMPLVFLFFFPTFCVWFFETVYFYVALADLPPKHWDSRRALIPLCHPWCFLSQSNGNLKLTITATYTNQSRLQISPTCFHLFTLSYGYLHLSRELFASPIIHLFALTSIEHMADFHSNLLSAPFSKLHSLARLLVVIYSSTIKYTHARSRRWKWCIMTRGPCFCYFHWQAEL